MILKNKNTSFIVLDLDDTIYKEVNFVRSGFKALILHYAKSNQFDHDSILEMMMHSWRNGQNAIKNLFIFLDMPDFPIKEALNIYRTHYPDLELPESSRNFFEIIKAKELKLGLITDGRSITQRNKLKSLGIGSLFDQIIISEEFGSEKPDIRNYEIFQIKYPGHSFCYIGDNTKKDFISPLKLGWETFCIKSDGRNIHSQSNLADLEVTVINNLNEYFYHYDVI
jgi:putative hydrolase of the HAD superfamily